MGKHNSGKNIEHKNFCGRKECRNGKPENLPDIRAIVQAIPFEAEIEAPSEEDFVLIPKIEYAMLIERSTRLSVLTNLQRVHFPDGDPRFHNLRREITAVITGGVDRE